MPSKKPTRMGQSARAKTPPGVLASAGAKVTVAIAICVMAGGILIAARQQSRPGRMAPGDARVQTSMMPDYPATTVAASDASAVISVPPPASAPRAPSVTITGCLERADEAFRLKDTSGADAPKSRSWKSAFLKKAPASVAVVDAAHTLRLADQVGRRVSVTGTVVDREMRARSLRRVAASCGHRSGA